MPNRMLLCVALCVVAGCAVSSGPPPSPAPSGGGVDPLLETIIIPLCTTPSHSASTCRPDGEEFQFPASKAWLNLGSIAGFTNGADVTTLLQNAIDGAYGTYNVFYVPAGTYYLTATIVVRAGHTGMRFVGASPSTTIFKWRGPRARGRVNNVEYGSDMFLFDGLARGHIARFTLDGSMDASGPGARAGIKFVKTGHAGGSAEISEFTDIVYRNLEYGFFGNDTYADHDGLPSDYSQPTYRVYLPQAQALTDPTYADGGSNVADSIVRRSSFINIKYAGFSIAGTGNAAQWYVEDNFFQDNKTAIALNAFNTAEIYNNGFVRSTRADVVVSGLGGLHVVRDNLSLGSARFIEANAPWAYTYLLSVIHNGIDAEPAPGTVDPCMTMMIGGSGNITITDNSIRSLAACGTAGSPGVIYVSPYNKQAATAWGFDGGTDLTALHNTFSVPLSYAWSATLDTTNYPRLWHDDPDVYDPNVAVQPPFPTATPTIISSRQILEVTPSSPAPGQSFADYLQSLVNSAACFSGTRYVIHLAAGSYSLEHTITIPAKLDLAIVGDGAMNTALTWNGPAAFAFELTGPSVATLRDFQVLSNQNNLSSTIGNPGGVHIQAPDVAGGRIYSELMEVGNAWTGTRVSGLDHVPVQLEAHNVGGAVTAMEVHGNGAASASPSATAGVNMFGGGFTATKYNTFALYNWGKINVEGTWSEGATQGFSLDAGNSGYLTFASANHVAVSHTLESFPNLWDQPNFVVGPGFSGRVTLMNNLIASGISTNLTTPGNVLALGQIQTSWWRDGNGNWLTSALQPARLGCDPSVPGCWTECVQNPNADPSVCAAPCNFMTYTPGWNAGEFEGIANREYNAGWGSHDQQCDFAMGGPFVGVPWGLDMLSEVRKMSRTINTCAAAGTTDVRLHGLTFQGFYPESGGNHVDRMITTALQVN